jgi:NDP-sugar pyrophosphorylase family protein
MLAVGDRPVLQHLVEQLRHAGIEKVSIATHYLSEAIVNHFDDGRAFGVDIEYVHEDNPLGTAGALGMLPESGETMLVINGDILTNIDFGRLTDFHHKHNAVLTAAVRKYDITVPYGVVETDGAMLRRLVEKPTHSVFVNAGIYLVEPQACALIPRGRHCDMPDLIQLLLDRKERVATFPVLEYWMDIGHHDDYRRAQEDAPGLTRSVR